MKKPTGKRSEMKTDEANGHEKTAAKVHRLRRRKTWKRAGAKAKRAKRHRAVMHDGELVRALERDYSHAKREYHGVGEALREAREAHEVAAAVGERERRARAA